MADVADIQSNYQCNATTMKHTLPTCVMRAAILSGKTTEFIFTVMGAAVCFSLSMYSLIPRLCLWKASFLSPHEIMCTNFRLPIKFSLLQNLLT